MVTWRIPSLFFCKLFEISYDFCKRFSLNYFFPQNYFEKCVTENEMGGWHHPLDGHESEQTLGDGEGQGSPACCSPWAHKESDMTE